MKKPHSAASFAVDDFLASVVEASGKLRWGRRYSEASKAADIIETLRSFLKIDERRTDEFQVFRGDNSSDQNGWIQNKDFLTRLVGPFDLQRNKRYDLSLRVTHVAPTLASTTPSVMLIVDPMTAKGPTVAASFWSLFGFAFVVVGILRWARITASRRLCPVHLASGSF